MFPELRHAVVFELRDEIVDAIGTEPIIAKVRMDTEVFRRHGKLLKSSEIGIQQIAKMFYV